MVGTPQPWVLMRAGEGSDAGLGAGGNQDVVVLQVIVLVAVVLGDGAHGGRKHRDVHFLTEQSEGGVHRLIFADGVHVHTQLLPLLVVTDKAGADALGAGAGHGILAGQTVAGGAGFAVGAHAGAGLIEYFFVCHDDLLQMMYSPMR